MRLSRLRAGGFYAAKLGRPSLPPGRYFRLMLVGYFEGLSSERGMAWRASDSLAIRKFLGLELDEAAPDHSTVSRTRRLIDLETHERVFTWVLERLAKGGLLVGKTIGIDATTLEANAAMKSIVRRDTGASYEEFLKGLAKASGIRTPTREALARLDRRRKNKASNEGWTHPSDPDAKITKMKDLLFPGGGLALDSNGNIFGTTQRGGDSGYGSVFELSRSDHSYGEIHSFHGVDGITPVGDLFLDETGELYGTALGGGDFGRGTAFKLGTDGTYTVLHSFGGPRPPGDGMMPVADLAADGNGNLNGTTPQGGPMGGGALFKLEANGGYTVLHGFSFGPGDGTIPLAGVVANGSGNLYGTTSRGGAFDVGVVFKFASDGTYSLLHNFIGSDGSNPLGALILDSSGNLFGTTSTGGAAGLGNVFKIARGRNLHEPSRFRPGRGRHSQGQPGPRCERQPLRNDFAGRCFGSGDGLQAGARRDLHAAP